MVLQSQSIAPASEIKNGTSFWEVYQGNTRTGWGQVSKIWEVSEDLGNGTYVCKAISDNTVGRLNPEYRQSFTEAEIKRIMARTPILDLTAAPNKCTYPNG